MTYTELQTALRDERLRVWEYLRMISRADDAELKTMGIRDAVAFQASVKRIMTESGRKVEQMIQTWEREHPGPYITTHFTHEPNED